MLFKFTLLDGHETYTRQYILLTIYIHIEKKL